MTTKHETCPECGNSMPVHAGYVTWCDQCNWNLDPKAVRGKPTLIEKLNEKVGERAMRSVHEEVTSEVSMHFPWTPRKAFAYAVAALIHALGLWCLYQTCYHVYYMNSIAHMFLSVIYGALSYHLLPRFGRMPKDVLDRNRYPVIYRLVDAIAEQFETDKIEHVSVIRAYNASFSIRGLLRKKVVGIGIPLFSALDTQEKIAILSHELAHSAHRDVTRSWFVGSAMRTLGGWYEMIAPNEIVDVDDEFYYFRLVWLRKLAANLIFWIWYALGISVWREMQRAEYYADRRASEIAGTDASVAALRKISYAPTFHLTLERVAQFRYTKELFDEFRTRIVNVPEREKLRLERIRMTDSARLDATHPPTKFRVDYLTRNPYGGVALLHDRSSIEALEAEFTQLEKSMQLSLLDDYRAWYL